MNNLLLPSLKEQSIGFRYTIFTVVFLPPLMGLILSAAGILLPAAHQNFLYFAINFAVVALVFRRFLTASLLDAVERWLRIGLVAVIGFVVYSLLSYGLGRLITLLRPDFGNANDSNIAQLAKDNFLLTAVGTVILVPISEECMHRGAVFGMIRRKNRLAAYLISTVLFAVMHIDSFFGLLSGPALLLSFLQYVPAGLCLAAAYEISGSIFAPVLIHMAVNALGIFALR
jgi:membrane protease YdiL (CAAX protease family)